jgi:hypothetical protein
VRSSSVDEDASESWNLTGGKVTQASKVTTNKLKVDVNDRDDARWFVRV